MFGEGIPVKFKHWIDASFRWPNHSEDAKTAISAALKKNVISRSLGGSSETRRQFRKVQDSAALDEMHYQGIIGQQTEPK